MEHTNKKWNTYMARSEPCCTSRLACCLSLLLGVGIPRLFPCCAYKLEHFGVQYRTHRCCVGEIRYRAKRPISLARENKKVRRPPRHPTSPFLFAAYTPIHVTSHAFLHRSSERTPAPPSALTIDLCVALFMFSSLPVCCRQGSWLTPSSAWTNRTKRKVQRPSRGFSVKETWH